MYRNVSLWLDTIDEPLTPRPALGGSDTADVAVVGAGYTGLWTAYYLLAHDPSLRVTLVEAEIAGFGASGRNGGWCSALFPVPLTTMAARHGRSAAVSQQQAMVSTLDEIERVLDLEDIDCHWARGGTIDVARTTAQLTRARAEVAEFREFGFGPDHVELLDVETTRLHVAASSVLGATFTPHCAAIQPARLVRGLARAVERRGGRIVEGTRALSAEPGVVHTDHGDVRAEHVVLATEGFTPTLSGYARDVVPIYSLMIATAPLADEVWDAIGLSARETFTDYRHLLVYGQRTRDGRLAFGGRGAPYHLGSRVEPRFDRDTAVFGALERTLVELFPVLAGFQPTHQWGGPLGATRDWSPTVRYDPATGMGFAGGYVGDGVSTTNLAGRTLADLILRRDTDLVQLPWVGHRSPLWEPEPLRWVGARAMLSAMGAADAVENRGGSAAGVAGVVNRVLGR